MDSKVVVTYKRKRLFSRSDHSIVNLHSGTSHESAKSKTTDNFPKKEGTVNEWTLENNDGTGFGNHAHSKDDVGEDVLQCENRDFHCCTEKHVGKPDSHYFVRAEQKDSSVTVEPQKCTPEQKCSPEADAKQIIGHPNVLLHENPEVRNTIDSSGRCNAVELSSECEASKRISVVSQPPDPCSGAEASTLVETDKSITDKNSSLCNNSGKKCKLSSSLITFCRRSKRSRADVAVDSATLPAASCSVNLKNEKENLGENNELCSFSTPAQDTSTVILADNPQHCPHGEAADAPNADAHRCQDSNEQMLQLKDCTDVQDNQRLLNEDIKSSRMHSDVSGMGDPVLSMDLSVPPHVTHIIDCNLPLDGASDENQPVENLDDLHDSLGSTSKINDDMSSFPVRASNDKGKCILDSPPLLTCNSSKNSYIQFLPEIRSDGVQQLPNNSEKVANNSESRLDPSSLQSSTSIGLSLQPEQMVDCRACFPPSYEWPNIHAQSRESFCYTQSLARDKMMLDNILTRARAVRGNRSTFLDKFEYPTTWLDEELDSLWIGVRRHGRGNWDTILGDPRLHFLPWKTSRDLAERWQVEQSRLLCTMPTSQRRYASPPDFLSEHVNSLHHPRPEGQMDEVRLSLGRSPPVQNSGFMKGGLPHWLRTAAEIPPDPARLAYAVPLGCHSGLGQLNHPSQQPWLSYRNIRRPEPENGANGPCSASSLVVERGKTRPDEHVVSKQEDLIVIPSDDSSEETISD